jgi:hypothetical protein
MRKESSPVWAVALCLGSGSKRFEVIPARELQYKHLLTASRNPNLWKWWSGASAYLFTCPAYFYHHIISPVCLLQIICHSGLSPMLGTTHDHGTNSCALSPIKLSAARPFSRKTSSSWKQVGMVAF